MILAGDVGGTKVELSLFEDVKSRKIVKEERFLCKDYKSLEEMVQAFLSNHSFPITHSCFGIAGPIEGNICRATNLPWIVNGVTLAKLLHIPHVSLINDLEANAWGITCLRDDELYLLTQGSGLNIGNKALISAGTGLGEAGLYFDGKKHVPLACEGGHCNFAPTNEEEVEIWRYLQAKYSHVSYERILSGAGLENLYRFWVEVKKEKELPQVQERILKEDPAKVIYEYGSTGQCPICEKAVHRFVSVYGSEAGNLALKFLLLAAYI